MTRWRRHTVSILLAAAVLLWARSATAQTEQAPRCGTGVHEEEATGRMFTRTDLLRRSPTQRSRVVRELPGGTVPLDDPSGRARRSRPSGWAQLRPGRGADRTPEKAFNSTRRKLFARSISPHGHD